MFAARNMLFARSAAALSYRATVLADNPVAYWRLGESSGTTAADEMGSHPGTYVGSPTLGVTGAVAGNTAATFNGSTQRVSASAALSALPLSFEAWVNPTNVSGNKTVVCIGRNSATRHAIYMEIAGSRVGLYRFTNGSFSYADSASGVITSGNWQHLVATVSSIGAVTLYRNGSSVIVGSVATDMTGVNVSSVGAFVDSNGSFLNLFNGSIDEVAIYNTALSPERIAAHYAAATS